MEKPSSTIAERLERVDEKRAELECQLSEAKFRRDKKRLRRELATLDRLSEWFRTRAGYGRE